MGDPAIKFKSEPDDKKVVKLEDHIKETITDELVFGLCGPIGTDIRFVANSLKEILEDDFGYSCEIIKLSSFIKKIKKIQESERLKNGFEFSKNLIDKGNELREQSGDNILSKIAIHRITSIREQNSTTEDDLIKSKRHCYIIDSIKHFEEYELLKKVYSEIFYFIGVFSPEVKRKENLKNKGIEPTRIDELISIDSEQKEDSGQKVRDTFVKADYFLRIEESNNKVIKEKLIRFLDLIFGTEVVTPTKDETAMYLASSAAGNSACLSRQVGASITDGNGEILSVGWNDVPKAGGNLYPEVEDGKIKTDHRCINKEGGKCFNDFEKDLIADEIADILISERVLDSKAKAKVREIIRKNKIKDLIEFSRSVHAEMHAIINASQKAGSQMIGGKLFCTTYPCHNCARHIVAAGIKDIYYIEPYTKSLALKLHGDSLEEREDIKSNKVRLLIYDGVAPNRYSDLFKMSHSSERKKNGKKIITKRKDAKPRKSLSLDAIPFLEQKATEDLASNNLKEYLPLLI